MDLRMPGMSGIEATWQLGTVSPTAQVLVLTVSEPSRRTSPTRSWPAPSGYVVKGAADDEIIDAVRGVAAGERVISPQVAGKLVERVRGDREDPKAFTPSRAAPSAAVSDPNSPHRHPGPAAHGSAGAERVGDDLQAEAAAQTLLIAVVVRRSADDDRAGRARSRTATGTARPGSRRRLNILAAFALINIGLLAGRSRELPPLSARR